jgi:hypothetical protein
VRVVEHFAAFLRETGRVAEADELEAREAELRAAVSSDASSGRPTAVMTGDRAPSADG